ncbi:hypothetical protein A0O28_0070900 [Trichoderma guizhouense]|uniref:Uncharacterized protein n=1 Tax=Trichoderma guizhouense TaxID=1491466 RepID=A0A1T3D0V9_9HYPO|nr:hypothetical protein A0O28_0070900 [Trichoderma guizhouense]
MSETPTLQEPLQEPPPPPILERNGFQLRNRVFSIDGVEREDGPRLQKLFNLSTLSQPQDQRYTETDTLKLYKKRFFTAQLQFYEIPFKKSSSKPQLYLLLQDACDRLPLSILELETIMRADHEPLQAEWEANYIAWRKEKRRRNDEALRLAKRREDEAFRSARSASERARLDPQRFLDMYFMTDGKPDTTKVRRPLVLRNQNVRTFQALVKKRVPGLYTWRGPDRLARNVYIGWDTTKVMDLAISTSNSDEKANKAHTKALWRQQLERHQEYIAQAQLGEPSRGPTKHPEGLSLDRCKGSYVVRCKKITEEWLTLLSGHTFTVDICSRDENTLNAVFDFGIVEGTMILSLDEQALRVAVREAPKVYYGSEVSEEEEDEDEDEVEIKQEEDECDLGLQDSVSGGKRRQDEASLEQLAGPASAKRRKTSPTPSWLDRRVYFRFRGRETQKHQVIPDPEAGYVHFQSDDCVKFYGMMHLLPWVGEDIDFVGYKVSDTPRVNPEHWETFQNWEAFSWDNYGYTNVKWSLGHRNMYRWE